jgi:hypothetical protein
VDIDGQRLTIDGAADLAAALTELVALFPRQP